MVAIAGAIIKQRTGTFDPATYPDRYQQALRELIEAKMKGIAVEPKRDCGAVTCHRFDGRVEAEPRAGAPGSKRAAVAAKKGSKRSPDHRQPALLLPVTGDGKGKQAAAEPATAAASRRKRA
jgi:DNA end-binding protein Ku